MSKHSRVALMVTVLFLSISAQAPIVIAATCTPPGGLPACYLNDFDGDGTIDSRDTAIKVDNCGANGFDEIDDTSSWKSAIYCLKSQESYTPYLGSIEGTSDAHYIISDTLSLNTGFGGVIDGRGSVLVWTGASDRPLFSFEDTQLLRIRDITLTVLPDGSAPIRCDRIEL